MLDTIHRTASGLAYEEHGEGMPVVFLHGLTFDRTTWRPIIERLGDGVRSIAFDLPGHGDTAGEPCTVRETPARIKAALDSLAIREPVIVGHSISSAIASLYAASYPVRGLVNVEGTTDIRPMAELVRRLEPVLKSDRFADAFAPFQQSMGFEHVPEPLRTRELESQNIRQEIVLGYWEQLFREDPNELQQEIAAGMASIEAPCLSVFGHELSADERTYLEGQVRGVQIEEWPDRGHLIHLAEADRFTARLRSFIARCRMDALADGHFGAEAAGDLQAIANGFTADAEHDVAGRPGPPLHGGEQIRAFYEALLTDLEITRFERVRRWYGENHLVDESILHGVAHGRPFGLEGRGRDVHVRILHVFDFAQDRIDRESAWLDLPALQQQLAT
jgi:pimeloyl-ACP methyl ester carboxylesterase